MNKVDSDSDERRTKRNSVLKDDEVKPAVLDHANHLEELLPCCADENERTELEQKLEKLKLNAEKFDAETDECEKSLLKKAIDSTLLEISLLIGRLTFKALDETSAERQ